MREKIVAIGLLTQKELGLLGPAFDRAFPIEEAPPQFRELLDRIDEVEARVRAALPEPNCG
jgi:hypothetical protein